MTSSKFWCLAGAALLPAMILSAGMPAMAADPPPRQLSVNGHGEVAAPPDLAVISLGVEARADTAKAALAENSKAMAAVLARLQAVGVAEKDVQTTAFNIWPVQSNDPEGREPPKTIGYQVSNQVTVRLRQIDRVGAVLDQLVQEGANTMTGLAFQVAEPEPLQQQARDAAVADGLAKAKRYAAAAGVKLGPLQALSEAGGGGQPMPYARKVMAEALASDVPVAPGEATFSADVSLVFALD